MHTIKPENAPDEKAANLYQMIQDYELSYE